MANAERRYWASNARYASLEELRANGDPIPSRASYAYSVEASDTAFKIVGTYSGDDPRVPKHLSIDQTMALTED